MVTVSEVVRPLVNQHGEVHWKVGVVLAVDTTQHKLTVAFVGATSGQGTPNVGYVDSYVPQVNHIVHCITAETRGALALGSTGTAPPGWNGTSAMDLLLDAGPDAVSDPARSGTIVATSEGRKFSNDLVRQGPGYLGLWSIPDLSTAITAARALGVISRIEIEVTMVQEGPRAVLTTITNVDGKAITSEPVRRSDRLEVGVPTRIALPIGWLSQLETGSSAIGLSDGSTVPMAAFDLSASVYLTVETV